MFAASRFIAVDRNRLIKDRYRFSASEEPGPDGVAVFMETLLYREPDQMVRREG